jgi:hypothetical protein
MRNRFAEQCRPASGQHAGPAFARSRPVTMAASSGHITFPFARSWAKAQTRERRRERSRDADAPRAARGIDRSRLHRAQRVRIARRVRDWGVAGVGPAIAGRWPTTSREGRRSASVRVVGDVGVRNALPICPTVISSSRATWDRVLLWDDRRSNRHPRKRRLMRAWECRAASSHTTERR